MRVTLIFILITFNLYAQIYVSTEGNDVLGNGEIENPIRTIKKAFQLSETLSDTIYLRGGVYEESLTLEPTISGSESQYKCLFAFPGDYPIIDFSLQEYSSSNRGFKLTKNYWHLRGLEIKNAGDNGIHISGHHNKVENCSLHHNKDTGLQISNGGSYNSIINCDSYMNYDPNTHGENADGFAPKLDIGPGNNFKKCRAWLNSDDGWDCYEGQNQMIIDSCWAFQNGFNIWNDSAFEGDGNGFKLGGNYISAPHIIRNSIAFDNKAKGFDQNHNTAGITVLNCTAYRNERNFVFNEDPTDSVHVLINNISHDGAINVVSSSVETNNSWNGFNTSWQDFASLDTSLARILRDEKYRIPQTDFLRLKPGSQFIDAGIDVGIPYLGIAPDLGAFEYDETATDADEIKSEIEIYSLEQNYPNPFNPTTTIRYSVPKLGTNKISKVSLKVYDVIGKLVEVLIDENRFPGSYKIEFNGDNLPSGIYLYRLIVNDKVESKKMMLLK